MIKCYCDFCGKDTLCSDVNAYTVYIVDRSTRDIVHSDTLYYCDSCMDKIKKHTRLEASILYDAYKLNEPLGVPKFDEQ